MFSDPESAGPCLVTAIAEREARDKAEKEKRARENAAWDAEPGGTPEAGATLRFNTREPAAALKIFNQERTTDNGLSDEVSLRKLG
jgi:hypothetical protein